MSLIPFTRTLPYVLRRQLNPSGRIQFLIGKVAAIPDAQHVEIEQISGLTTIIPRVSSYTPTVGEPAYCLTADTLALALGAVGGATAGGTPGPAGPPGPTGPTGPAGAQGPQGVKGDTGAAGAPGAAGAQGPQGIQGPAGPSGASTFLSGSGAPTAGVGVDGAVYLDYASGRLYGPKAAGAWPSTALGRIVPLAPTYAQIKNG